MSLEEIPRSGMTESHGHVCLTEYSLPNGFLKSGCPLSQSHQRWMRVPAALVLTCLPLLIGTTCLFDANFRHFNRYAVVLHGDLKLYFTNE